MGDNEETRPDGATIVRQFVEGDRYRWDAFCSRSEGWRQWDTTSDAPYFGVWVNRGKLQVLTFCEGDLTVVTCPTPETFRKELQTMVDFYGAPPPAATVIDLAANTIARLFDRRLLPADIA